MKDYNCLDFLRDAADILEHRNIEITENFYISSTEESRKYAIDITDNIIKYKIK